MRSTKVIGRIAAALALAGLCLWGAFAVVIYQETRELRTHYSAVMTPFNALGAELGTAGLPPDLQQRLAALPRDKVVAGFALVDATTGQVVVGDRPEMAGKPMADVASPLTVFGPPFSYERLDLHSTDGHTYWLVALHSGLPIGYNRGAHVAFGGGGLLLTGLAWLGLALWLFVDARRRSPAHALAWGLLGLVTGPIGLSVYRIVRPEAEVCPGCGGSQEPGGPFCPHCGFALRPTCPDCHQAVDHAWRHCRSCGTSLQA